MAGCSIILIIVLVANHTNNTSNTSNTNNTNKANSTTNKHRRLDGGVLDGADGGDLYATKIYTPPPINVCSF